VCNLQKPSCNCGIHSFIGSSSLARSNSRNLQKSIFSRGGQVEQEVEDLWRQDTAAKAEPFADASQALGFEASSQALIEDESADQSPAGMIPPLPAQPQTIPRHSWHDTAQPPARARHSRAAPLRRRSAEVGGAQRR
jgi:hypothetical protein